MTRTLTILLTFALAGSAGAQTLGERLDNSLRKTGEAIENTVNTVGKATEDAVGKVGTAVSDSLDGAVELVQDEATPEETRARIDATGDATMARLRAEVPGAEDLIGSSKGYVVFDTRQVSLLVTAAYGRGVAVEQGSGTRTYMRMGMGGVGSAFGLGGFESQLVILFEDLADFRSFTQNGFDATASATGSIGDDATDQGVTFVDGRSYHVLRTHGWRVAASLGGTRYWPDPNLN